MHIWDEIVNGSSTLTQSEVEEHIQTYNQLWNGIINVIEALDRTQDGVVDDHDISMINSELQLAVTNIQISFSINLLATFQKDRFLYQFLQENVKAELSNMEYIYRGG